MWAAVCGTLAAFGFAVLCCAKVALDGVKWRQIHDHCELQGVGRIETLRDQVHA